MSLNVPLKRLTKKLRLPILIDGLKHGLDFIQIGKLCGVSEKTIDRDFAEWKENGGFDKWLLSEYMRLHNIEVNKEAGGQSYRTTADLVKKSLREKSEVKLTGGMHDMVEIIDNSKVQDAPETT